jgi:uncharacterized protein (TIGR02300 family)
MGKSFKAEERISDVRSAHSRPGVASLSKAELGTKRDCPNCGAKFYDLNRNPVACPKCKHEFVPDGGAKVKRAKPVEKPKEKPAPARAAVVDEDGDTVSLDAMRDEELAADDIEDVDIEDIDDDAEDDAFLPQEDDENDDVSDIVRHGGDDDE